MSTFKLSKTTQINKVPTNIVTGFLGSGKSTLIHSLINNKSNDEHWVILINEFGDVGLDDQIIESKLNTNAQRKGQVQISQIAGGCLCCANGVPFQVALVQLLKQQDKSPDRLIIEPTGLGHPNQIINQLSALSYIDMQTVFTVVDPRKVKDSKYAEHELFTTQISVASVVVCNKQDLFDNTDVTQFENWMIQKSIQPSLIIQTQQGVIEPSLLTKYTPKIHTKKPKINLLLNSMSVTAKQDSVEFMEYQPQENNEPIQQFEQNLEGFYAVGYIFDQRFKFDEDALINELMSIDAIRVKAIVNLLDKTLIINATDSVFTQSYSQKQAVESRFQFIGERPLSIIDIKALIHNTVN